MACENCQHWIAYRPIGGFLPSMYRGMGSCYPDGTKGHDHSAVTMFDRPRCALKPSRFERKRAEARQ